MGNIKGELRVGEADVSAVLRREITIRGTWNSKVVPKGHDEWSTALAEIGRGIKAEPLISHRIPLSEGASAFEMMRSRREPYGKVVLVPEDADAS